jgi:dolichol-phosphate mannosyltransferase
MRCYVLLPAYNERRSLLQLVPSIRTVLTTQGIPYTIVVVNDASSDGTADIFKDTGEPSGHLISHPKNQGYGAALRSGFVWIAKNAQAGDVAISLDADTTHDPAYLPGFFKPFSEGAEVVTASYVVEGASVSGVSPLRRLMSNGANFLFALAFPKPGVHTYTNGYRGYNVALLQKLYGRCGEALIVENGFAGGTELFLRALKTGAVAAEIPFNLHYERRGADSKIRIGPTIAGYLALLRRLRTENSVV